MRGGAVDVGLCCSCLFGDDTGVRLGVEVICSQSIRGAGGSLASDDEVTSASIPVAVCSSIANLCEDLGVPMRAGGWIVEWTRMESLS